MKSPVEFGIRLGLTGVGVLALGGSTGPRPQELSEPTTRPAIVGQGACERVSNNGKKVGFDCHRAGKRVWVIYKGAEGTEGSRIEYSDLTGKNPELVDRDDSSSYGPFEFTIRYPSQPNVSCDISGITTLVSFDNRVSELCKNALHS